MEHFISYLYPFSDLWLALKKGGIDGTIYGTSRDHLEPGKNRIATAITQRIGSNTVNMVVTAAFQPVVFAARTCVIPMGKTTATRKKATPIIMAALALRPPLMFFLRDRIYFTRK